MSEREEKKYRRIMRLISIYGRVMARHASLSEAERARGMWLILERRMICIHQKISAEIQGLLEAGN